MAVATIVMSSAQRKMERRSAIVIIASGKADGKSAVSILDSSL